MRKESTVSAEFIQKLQEKESEARAVVLRQSLFDQEANFKEVFKTWIVRYASTESYATRPVPQLIIDLMRARTQESSEGGNSSLRTEFITMLIEYLREYYQYVDITEQNKSDLVKLSERERGGVRHAAKQAMGETVTVIADEIINEYRDLPVSANIFNFSKRKKQIATFLKGLIPELQNKVDLDVQIAPPQPVIDQLEGICNVMFEKGHQAAMTAMSVMHQHVLQEDVRLAHHRKNIVSMLQQRTEQEQERNNNIPDLDWESTPTPPDQS